MKGLIRSGLLVAALLLACPANAVVMVPLSIEALAERADVIVEGTVVSRTCQRDASGRIYTLIELKVTDVWKGLVKQSPLIVVHGGGTLGERRSVVDGQVEFLPGEEVVGFFVNNDRGEAVTLGLSQGKFQVWKDGQTGEKMAANPFHGLRPGASVARASAGAGAETAGLTLSQLRRRVQGVAQ